MHRPRQLWLARPLIFIAPTSDIDQFDIDKGGIIGRDSQLAAFVLDHPQVSRVHARLSVNKDRVTLSDLGSSNGTFCNGTPVVGQRILLAGDTIDIGPFSLVFDGKTLKSRSRASNVQLRVADVSYTVVNAENRQKLTLLHEGRADHKSRRIPVYPRAEWVGQVHALECDQWSHSTFAGTCVRKQSRPACQFFSAQTRSIGRSTIVCLTRHADRRAILSFHVGAPTAQ